MILMSVRDYDAPELVNILFNIAEIGDDDINAEHLAVGKSKTAVNDEHIVRTLNDRKILTDLVKTSEGDDPDGSMTLRLTLLHAAAAWLFLLLRLYGCIFLP